MYSSGNVVVKQSIHLIDRVEWDVDNGLEWTNFLQFLHNNTQGIDVFDHSLGELVIKLSNVIGKPI